MMTHEVLDLPLEVTAIEGEIAITGPDGLAGSLTVEAARISAQRLLRAVEAITGDTDPPPGAPRRPGPGRRPRPSTSSG